LPDRKKRDKEQFIRFSAAIDTAYSQKSPDTIAMSFLGITNRGRCIVLDERVYNNAELQTPIAPSDTVRNLIDFLDRNRKIWGFARDVFIDSADQATLTEFAKYKRQHGCVYNAVPAWKKMTIIDRINTQLGWLAHGDFLVVDSCKHYIAELNTYSWREDKDNTPEDAHDHMINSVQYAWIPYKNKIGGKT
ncbi:MAG: terminase, partial [Eubacteriales bacterium]|nr:terminase [Eubacteriales bacterium]